MKFVLTKPRFDVTACLQHAAENERHAKLVADQDAKEFFLDIAARWYRIAETFEYTRRIERF
jgi:hypothetical protein